MLCTYHNVIFFSVHASPNTPFISKMLWNTTKSDKNPDKNNSKDVKDV